MNAIPPSFTAEHGAANTAGVRWTALSDAAGIVATLAGADPLADMDEAADFPLRIGNVEPDITPALAADIREAHGQPKRIFCTYTALLAIRRELSKITTVEVVS